MSLALFVPQRGTSAQNVCVFRLRRYRAFALLRIYLHPGIGADAANLDLFNSCKFVFLRVRLVCDRWAWEHGKQSSAQQLQEKLGQRRLHQQYLQQQFARDFDEDSISETEEDDDQLWDRVQYWFQI